MNKLIKILLLLVVLVGLSSAVLVYMKTIVSPPQRLTFKNQYVDNLKKDISYFNKVDNIDSRDSLYDVITHELDYQKTEGYLSFKERDVLMDEFASFYTPLFMNDCRAKFNSSEWNENDHPYMKRRVAELLDFSINEGSTKVIQGNLVTLLEDIVVTIDLYYKAKEVSRKTEYYGIKSARNTIDKAEGYAKTVPLSNCTSLVSALNNVAVEIGNNHYRYLQRRINCVLHYDNYWNVNQYESFKEYANDVLEELNDYRDKTPFYSTHYNVQDLIETRNSSVKYAYYNYFEIEQ